MSASERYTTMAAVLDDPLNRAIAERELLRRKRPLDRGLVPPPIPREGGGFVILSMREYQRFPAEKIVKGAEVDYIADVWLAQGTRSDWWVTLTDGSEVGPFPTSSAALVNARSLVEDEGYTVLDALPWSAQDAEEYPFTSTLL